MNTGFRTLWTVSVSHTFHDGVCDALRFVVPPATQADLKAMRCTARELNGQLHVLIEEDADGHAMVDSTGRTLVFGLQPASTLFSQYTRDPALTKGDRALFTNEADVDVIGALPRGVRIEAPRMSITPTRATRPLTLRALSAEGLPRASVTLKDTDAAWHWDAGALSGEVLITEEVLPGHVLAQQRLFIGQGLSDCWGLLQLQVAAGHVLQGHAFTLSLAARTDVLRYYVLVKPVNPADLDSIKVVDQGAAAAGRTPIGFTAHLPPFGAGHLTPDLLDPDHTRQVVLFEADAPLARQARGPHGIALQRLGEVVIGDLPQPGAERSDAQFVVHLSKP